MKMSLSASVQPCASHHDAASKHPFPRPKRARRAAKKGPMRPHAENMSSAQSPPSGRGIGGLRPPFLKPRTPMRSIGCVAKRSGGGGKCLSRVTCPLTPTLSPPGRGTAPASVISSASDHGAGHSEIHLQDVEAAGETIHRVDDGALVDEHVVELDRFRR